jgi:hypothetical protein
MKRKQRDFGPVDLLFWSLILAGAFVVYLIGQ